MRHLPHGTKKWILHCVDHWSKFNFAYALDSKTAENVADILRTHIFPYFGVPRILHSDNGREFINQVIVNLLKEWHSNIQLISGRPRHPQSQGLVERAHQTLHKKLATEISTSGMKAPPWNEWLPKIICKSVFSCLGNI
jgi:transposase InsO family protein